MLQYSFVVPIYNDAYLAEDFCREFERVMSAYLARDDISSDVELIFVNDGSTDESSAVLSSLAGKKYSFVRAIELSRNFGQHIALTCGYQHAGGSYVGMLNVDMQEHPDQIPLLLNRIREGDCDIAYGLREARMGSITDRWSSLLFNVVLRRLTGSNTPLNVATLRVMNRRFTNAYNSLSEKTRYLPGLEHWLGFKVGYVGIRHVERQRGRSSYDFRKRLAMAVESIISFSDLPLRMVALAGAITAVIGFVLGLVLMVTWLTGADVQPGYTSTLSIIVFLGGVQILVTGLGSIYIGRILREVQNRPLYLVRQTFNLGE